MTHTAAIKIMAERISHLVRLVSNQTIVAIPIKGTVKPPGARNDLSEARFVDLNFTVASITPR